MKKIKTVLIVIFVCALGYGSYTAYDYITMTDTERFLLANVEALTDYEDHTGGLANSYCPIWNVTYTTGFPWPSVTCETGGQFKCKAGKCPHE